MALDTPYTNCWQLWELSALAVHTATEHAGNPLTPFLPGPVVAVGWLVYLRLLLLVTA